MSIQEPRVTRCLRPRNSLFWRTGYLKGCRNVVSKAGSEKPAIKKLLLLLMGPRHLRDNSPHCRSNY